MFKIADGRECLYQWDLDRRVIVDDPSITEVHFCNRTDDCSLVVNTYLADKLYANIPNILLQNSFDIRVFGYDGKATLHDEVFKVKARTKPADYVYTETEIRNYSELSKRITELEDTNGIFRLVLPAVGEIVTDERTIEILKKYTIYVANNSKYYPLCSYNGTLVTGRAGHLSGTLTLTAVRAAALTSSDYFIEYDLLFNWDSDIGAIRFIEVREYRRRHFSKTSQLENDAEFTTKAYVDESIQNATLAGVDLSEYAKLEDIPDTSAFLTFIPEEYVTESELEAKGYLTQHQSLDGKADKVHTHKLSDITDYVAPEIPSLDGYATEAYVTNAINTAFAGIATAEGGSY